MLGSAKRNILMFQKLCGDNALKNVITDREVGEAREKQLIEIKEYWGYMASKVGSAKIP
jgi:hypothetical protein